MDNRTAAGSVTPSDPVSGTYTNNRLNQIVGYNSSWGGGANTMTSTLQYDQGGNLTRHRAIGTGSATSTHTEYVYDDIDRLTAVITKNPSTLANQNKTEFQYDGLSRLKVTKEFTWSGSAWTLVSNSEKRRVYDGMDVVQERDGSNSVTVTYTRDGNIGGILSRRSGSTSYYYHYDGSGNVVGMTDSSQNSVAEYAYDGYGNLLSSSGAQANNNNYRYSTKEYLGSIGLYNYGYRFYSPGFGRWVNRDPLGEVGGLNLYGFVSNSPINTGDPYGLFGVRLGNGPNIGLGDPTFHFDGSSLDNLGSDAGKGLAAGLDGANPFGNPLADNGYYDPCEGWVPWSRGAGAVAAVAGTGAAGAAGVSAAGGILSSGAVNSTTASTVGVTVYRSINAAGDVQYVGITNNLARRITEHASRFDIQPIITGLSRAEARAVEQALIEHHGLIRNGGTLLNRINSIARTNPIYEQAINRGSEILRNTGYGGF